MSRNRPSNVPDWLKANRVGGAAPRVTNVYGNPCPDCGAARYERCFKSYKAPSDMKLSQDDIADGASHDGGYIYIKDKPCARRVTLYRGIDKGWHPYSRKRKGKVEGNDNRGSDV